MDGWMDGVEWEGRTRGRTGTRGGRRRKETTTTTAVAAGVQGGTRVEVVGPAQQRQTRVASCFTLAGSVLDNPQIEKVVGFKKREKNIPKGCACDCVVAWYAHARVSPKCTRVLFNPKSFWILTR